jgi:hypothetical protein
MIVAHQHERAFGLEQPVSVAAKTQRIVDMLHGLKAADQPESRRFEIRRAKGSLANESSHARRGESDGSSGRFDPDHVGETVFQKLMKEGAVAGSDIEGTRAIRKGSNDFLQETPIRQTR